MTMVLMLCLEAVLCTGKYAYDMYPLVPAVNEYNDNTKFAELKSITDLVTTNIIIIIIINVSMTSFSLSW